MTSDSDRAAGGTAGGSAHAWSDASGLGHALWQRHGQMGRSAGLGERILGHLSMPISRQRLAPLRASLAAGPSSGFSALPLTVYSHRYPIARMRAGRSGTNDRLRRVRVSSEAPYTAVT